MPHPSLSSVVDALKTVFGEDRHVQDDFFGLVVRTDRSIDTDSDIDRRHYRDLVSVTRLIRAYLTSSSLEVADVAGMAGVDAPAAADGVVAVAVADVATADAPLVAEVDAPAAADGAMAVAAADVAAADAPRVAAVDAPAAVDVAGVAAADIAVMLTVAESGILTFMEDAVSGSSAALSKLRESRPNQPQKFYHHLHARMLQLLRQKRDYVRSRHFQERNLLIQRWLRREMKVCGAPREETKSLIDSILEKMEKITVSLK